VRPTCHAFLHPVKPSVTVETLYFRLDDPLSNNRLALPVSIEHEQGTRPESSEDMNGRWQFDSLTMNTSVEAVNGDLSIEGCCLFSGRLDNY
jgi:hypothetical protein